MAGTGKLAWATYSQNRGSHPSPKLNGNESSALDAVNNGKRKTHCCDLAVEPSFASKSIPALEGYPRMVNVPMHLVDMVFPAQFRQFLDR